MQFQSDFTIANFQNVKSNYKKCNFLIEKTEKCRKNQKRPYGEQKQISNKNIRTVQETKAEGGAHFIPTLQFK